MIVNPLIWYAERELNFVPRHFIKCPTTLSALSKDWVQNKSNGRYAFADIAVYEAIVNDQNVYFEDEKDAIMYELLWASAST